MTHGHARFHVGMATRPGGLAMHMNKGGIGLGPIASLRRLRGKIGMCCCRSDPRLGHFTAPNDRLTHLRIVGGPIMRIGLKRVSIARGSVRLRVGNFVFTPTRGLLIDRNALHTPRTRIARRGAKTCALAPS